MIQEPIPCPLCGESLCKPPMGMGSGNPYERICWNPLRHGLNDSALCYICGDAVAPGRVLCKKHTEEWRLTNHRDHLNDFMHWCLSHQDFNGIHLNGKQALAVMYPKKPVAEEIYESLTSGLDKAILDS